VSKTFLRASKASGSTKRKIEAIVRRGARGVRRAVASSVRREFLERVDYVR